MENRDRPSGTTGIKFPKIVRNTQANGESCGTRISQTDTGSAVGASATHFVFVPVQPRTAVPIPVNTPSDSVGAPISTSLGKVAPKWTPDTEAAFCMGCGESFSMIRWRHHCRACGGVFCSSCSGHKLNLAYLNFNKVRVCNNCFGELTKDDSESMGAGVVKPQPGGRGFQIHINTGAQMPRTESQATGSNKCEECAVTFSAFKKKKPCKACGRDFCSACTVQVNGSSPRQQQCLKCQTLLSGDFTRSQLSNWKVKDLKALLNNQKVNTAKCKEKNDLIDLVFSNYGGNPNLNRMGTEHERMVEQLAERMRQENQQGPQSGTQQNQPPGSTVNQTPVQQQGTTTTTNPMQQSSQTQSETAQLDAQRQRERQQREMQEALNQMQTNAEEQMNESQPMNPNLKLDDVKSEEEIESLNIKSLKRLLLNNFVDYKGCCERWELMERVKRLWRDNEANKKKADEHRKISDDPSVTSVRPGDDELCKICMDAAIDCVLLECGHMVTCTNCGKRLAECPICRQYVVRAVHTFRS